jgi:hypothetical protein
VPKWRRLACLALGPQRKRDNKVRARVPSCALVALALLSATRSSKAEVPDSRFGLIPTVGGGIAVLSSTGSPATFTLPSFIGYTTLGGELFGQLRRWGLYGGFTFLSSGNAGRWTAYEGNLGFSYRLFGGSDSFALFARGGVVYQHWVGEQSGCTVLLFVPNSCVTEGENTVSINGDALGVSGGVRIEMPLQNFYIAFTSTLIPVVTVDDWPNNEPVTVAQSIEPGVVFQFRLELEVGFRDNRRVHKARHDVNEHRSNF